MQVIKILFVSPPTPMSLKVLAGQCWRLSFLVEFLSYKRFYILNNSFVRTSSKGVYIMAWEDDKGKKNTRL